MNTEKQLIIKMLFGNHDKDEQSKKQDIFWNMCASMAYSFQSALLLLIVNRIAGLTIAGIFTIAYTVSTMFVTVGHYSLRYYQVSDTLNKYSFDTYFSSRIITVILMFIACFGYCVVSGYNNEKLIIAIILCVYRAVDSYEDVYHGEIQKMGNLYVPSKIVFFRICGSIVLFAITFYITKSLYISSIVFSISAVIIAYVLNRAVIIHLEIKKQWQGNQIWKLLKETFPICAGSFLYSYLVNTPKFAIEAYLSDEIQTIFNIVFLPVFVISLISSFIYKPYLTDMGILWNTKEIKSFWKLFLKQTLAIVGLTLCVVVGGYVCGIPILSFIFNVSLAEHKGLFILLLIFGGIVAENALLNVVLTVMRLQNVILLAYVIALVINIFSMNSIVQKYSILGAGLMYGLIMGVVLLVSIVGCIVGNIKNTRHT